MGISDTSYKSITPAAWTEGKPIQGPHTSDDGLMQMAQNVNVLHKLACGSNVPGGSGTNLGHDHGENAGATVPWPVVQFLGYSAYPFYCSTLRTQSDYGDADVSVGEMAFYRRFQPDFVDAIHSGLTYWTGEASSSSMGRFFVALKTEYQGTWMNQDLRAEVAGTLPLTYRWVTLNDPAGNAGRYLVRSWRYPAPVNATDSSTAAKLITGLGQPILSDKDAYLHRWSQALTLETLPVVLPSNARLLDVYIPAQAVFDLADSREGEAGTNELETCEIPLNAHWAYKIWLHDIVSDSDGPACELPWGSSITQNPRYQRLQFKVRGFPKGVRRFSIRFQFNHSYWPYVDRPIHCHNVAIWCQGLNAGTSLPVFATVEV